ncbi:putative DDE superfamily endonuclease [Monocercomonoides exilis]|uniref:putative DDE superfamily endonuclease n=1 Tax=Monocercomonoides exilis TaxID=2049356 RepID=UPI00355A6F5E|nr:putative DDE superfamily endonuclease [Monocercomonoides exilis]|eukprot:MONOS_3940.1-p1 / transcript=MONOS_3940.1 / gene=MONOS_3940 / organism=Monocercomonoides_exilis_PA203 / gene_product=unspecified product / transcript_product=unspecified product / location=Mono_scaffold00098:57047-57883(+) / protein_length=278 / sequence_SO=supercontig / SO=protein_coding / is_pseudo=false
MIEKFFKTVCIIPQLIFNLDETSTVFSEINPSVVIPIHTSSSPIQPEPSLPRSTSIVFLTSSDGVRYLTPIIVPYSKIPEEFKEATTEMEVYTPSENGHLSSTAFFDVFSKAILPSVLKIRIAIGKPHNHAVLIMGSGTGHFSPEMLRICKDNLIDMIQRPSHTTHILQPNDQYVFANMKKCFRTGWKCGAVINAADRRKKFASLLKEAIAMASFPSTIKASWKITGWQPFNPEVVLKIIPDKPPEWSTTAFSRVRDAENSRSGNIFFCSDDLSDLLK